MILKYFIRNSFSKYFTEKKLNMIKRQKPVWNAPTNKEAFESIKIYNSLTNEKDVFKPREGNKVEWYSCGPTVYDVSHMGHARTYISIDILRRIMKDYFKYDVHYVMNITDVDDKIIKRARQNYLFDKYIESTKKIESIKHDLKEVLHYYDNKLNKEKDADMKIMLDREREGVAVLLNKDSIDKIDIVTIQDAVSSWLDVHHGHTVSDNSIFEDLPRKFEQLFMTDMRALNILPADDLTRVSEYIPKIIEFVLKIIDRGFAYESNSSVYFDTEKFDNKDGHYYAKLVPSAYGNESLLQEGEGALSNVEASEKRSKNDFALWKTSKSGEPSWDSPWGKGRPGWHIECSAMAGDKCGSHLDIHTGGVDLKFPHHDNELAQSEAYFGCQQWVNYFLHTGHLHIAGCKMSKSLKNFISIKDALARHSWRQLRLAFLLSSWKDTLDYSDDLMTASIVYEKMLLDFFFTIRSTVNSQRNSPTTIESELGKILTEAKNQFHSAICDSFDTRECMVALKKLVEEANKHCMSRQGLPVDVVGLTAVGEFVYEMMRMFGAAEVGNSLDLVQYNEEQLRETVANVLGVARKFRDNLRLSSTESADMAAFVEKAYNDFCESLQKECHLSMDAHQWSVETRFSHKDVDELLAVIGDWRQTVRGRSRENKWKSFLTICDDLRDNGLASVGVRLQDREGPLPAVGLYPVWAFEEKKVRATVQKAVNTKEKLAATVAPAIMFAEGPYRGQFSLYDSEGLPTHDADGLELSKNRRTKLKKAQGDQARKFAAN